MESQRSWWWMISIMVMFMVVVAKPLSDDSTVESPEPQILFRASLVNVLEEQVKTLGYQRKLVVSSDKYVISRLKRCQEMMIDSLELVNATIKSFDAVMEINEIRRKLTYAIIDHDTCLESLEEMMEIHMLSYQRNLEVKILRDFVQKERELLSNSLAIVTKIVTKQDKRSLLEGEETFPHWFGSVEKSLVTCGWGPHVTVATDGTGDYRTISEAVDSVPENSNSRFFIYVKEGNYIENVVVSKHKDNVIMYGDGNTKTIVSGARNRKDDPDLTTFGTATFSVFGNGFVVMNMKFINTAGAEKDQAVAFHSSSNQSIMYRCTFDGIQDTLYAHEGDQFYQECNIIGTVDFICGAANAVFLNCFIWPRQSPWHPYITVTAQGATKKMQSAFAIIGSYINPYNEVTVPTYLGRPWKEFATVVVMGTFLGNIVDPRGWKAWNDSMDPPRPTLTFGEYENWGPGSNVINRVNWVGYNPKMTNEEAQMYSVNALINQQGWLSQSCIPYDGSFGGDSSIYHNEGPTTSVQPNDFNLMLFICLMELLLLISL